MSKQLITANDIRDIHAKGQTQIEIVLPKCIITPEAREIADQLGVTILEKVDTNNLAPTPTKVTATTCNTSDSNKISDIELKAIRQAIIAKLPKDTSVNESLIDQLVCKALQDKKCTPNNTTTEPKQQTQSACPIKLVKGNSVNFELFEGAGKENQVAIADVIGAADNSSMAAGFMKWENAFFPWTLTYDEVNIVLEGELHIRYQGQTIISKPGDIMFIPKGSSIEFGTPTKVRFAYIAWPANWQ